MMKVVVNRPEFLSALRLVASGLPITGNWARRTVNLTAIQGGALRIRTFGQNGDVTAEFGPVDVRQAGTVFVVERELIESLETDAESVTLECEASGEADYPPALHIHGAAESFRIATLEVVQSEAAGPSCAGITEGIGFECDAMTLLRALNRVGYAMAKKRSGNYAVDAARVELRESKVTIACTDGLRWAVGGIHVQSANEGWLLAPRECLGMLARIRGVGATRAQVDCLKTVGDSQERTTWSFAGVPHCHVVTLNMTNAVGEFPHHERPVRPEARFSARVSRKALASACKQAEKWMSAERGGMQLVFDLEHKSLTTSVQVDRFVGWSKVIEIGDVQRTTDDLVTTGFNPTQLGELLAACDSTEITLNFGRVGMPMWVIDSETTHVLRSVHV